MIYLDNAATEKPDEKSVRFAEKYLLSEYYNPSALYAEGYNLHMQLKNARVNILSLIADPTEYTLIFASGGTEADNQAVFGGGKRGNIVATAGEHSAVFSAVNELSSRGIEVRFADLKQDGSVDIDSLLNLVDDKTSLVSVIHVNNETGAVNNVSDIARLVKQKNKYALFHSDGVQAFGKIPFKLCGDIDLYTINAHKIGGVKGCGALIKKKSLALKPFIFGGGQEQGLRSGTENMFAIKCFESAAAERYKRIAENYKIAAELNAAMRAKLDKSLFNVISSENASPYILTVTAKGLRGETVMHELNDRGLIVGTGSACSSNVKRRYSRVILACGLDESTADGVLRISFSPENTLQEVLKAAEIMNETVRNRKNIMA